MKNFPAINWALKLTHQGEQHAVVLPYHAYIKHLAIQPEDGAKLEEIRVLVDEPALLPRFNIPSRSMTIMHWRCSISSAVRSNALKSMVSPMSMANSIGSTALSPTAGPTAAFIRGSAPSSPRWRISLEARSSQKAETAMRWLPRSSRRLHQAPILPMPCSNCWQAKDPPAPLVAHKRMLRSARLGFRDHEAREALLRKLALFTLTSRQIGRIMFRTRTVCRHSAQSRSATVTSRR